MQCETQLISNEKTCPLGTIQKQVLNKPQLHLKLLWEESVQATLELSKHGDIDSDNVNMIIDKLSCLLHYGNFVDKTDEAYRLNYSLSSSAHLNRQ